MSLWRCPDCDAESILHVTDEFVEVYPRWTQFVSWRPMARALRDYNVSPQPSESAERLVRRWVAGDVDDAPEYVCTDCLTPFSNVEVPA
jgi:hypothetical protein